MSKVSKLQKVLLVPDCHIPYEDKKAFDLMLRAARAAEIDKAVILGDFADFWAVSSHSKSPARRKDMEWELDAVNARLDQMGDQFGSIHYTEGNHECLHPEHEVLTRSGWVPIAQAKAGEEILTLNPDRTTAWQEVQDTQEYPFSGDLYSWVSSGHEMKVTPNHRMPFYDHYGDLGYRTAQEFVDAGPTAKMETPTCGFAPDQTEVEFSDAEIQLLAWILTDGCLNPTPVIYQSKEKGKVEIERLLKEVGVAHSKSERQRDITEICGVKLKKQPLPEISYRVLKPALPIMAKLFGLQEWDYQQKKAKDLPQWTSKMSNRQAALFVESLVDGDGSRIENGGSEPTKMLYGRKEFLEQVQTLCVTHGIPASVCSRTRKGEFAYWVLNIRKSPQRRLMAEDMVRVPYEGPVHCVTVPNSNFFTRLNGKVVVTGNSRLERYLTDRAPELFSTVKVEKLLRLKERGVTWTPYKDYVKIGKLYVTHDAGKAGRGAARDAMNAFQGNVVIGHVHRIEYCVEGTAKGKPHVAASLGWLGDPRQVDYMHRIRAARDWAHGFGIAYVEPNGNVHVTPVPIVDGKCLVEGRLVK